MALDDAAIDRQLAASMLKAFRQDYGARGNRDAIEGAANSGVVLFPSATFRNGGQITFQKVDSVTIDKEQINELVE